MSRNLVFAILFLGTAVPVRAQEKQAERVRVETDIVYGKGGDQELKLDIALPADGSGPLPAVICVHGGAWRGGNKRDLATTIRTLASRGYVAASVQYRLCPQCLFPAQIEDCKCAVRFLRTHAAKYRIDPNRVGALGFSAGGHLVCLLGLTNDGDGLEGKGDLSKEQGEKSSRVQAVCCFFGPTDLTKNDWKQEVQPLLTDFLGGTFQEKRDLYLKASPISYVRKDPATPAFLFFHGTEDPLVPYEQSVRLHNALKGIGAPAELVTVEGEAHGWRGEKLRRSVEQMQEFFDKNLMNAHAK
jgi:acetyl esterase/lipase